MNNIKVILYLLVISLSLSACSSGGGKRSDANNASNQGSSGGYKKVGKPYKIAGNWYYPEHDPYYDETGIASWYGPNFHGKLTANGETFNMNALTAAHKTLAMPTYVKVTNIDNGRSIILRVNDRGPYVGTRLIDVSRRGAQILGFLHKGKANVRVQAADKDGKLIQAPDGYVRKKTYGFKGISHFVQIGAYQSKDTANTMVSKAVRKGASAQIKKVTVNGTKYYRVRVGPFKSRSTATKVLDRITSIGFYEARVTSERIE